MKKVILISLVATLSGCMISKNKPEKPEKQSMGMANPASLYCQKLGGQLEMITTDKGVTGYCTLPDGERVDEWALFKRNYKSRVRE